MAVNANTSYRNDEEKSIIIADIKNARKYYENCVKNFTID